MTKRDCDRLKSGASFLDQSQSAVIAFAIPDSFGHSKIASWRRLDDRTEHKLKNLGDNFSKCIYCDLAPEVTNLC